MAGQGDNGDVQPGGGKGKQQAAPDGRDDGPPPTEPEAAPSLLSRVGQSAADLSRSLVGGGHAAAEDLAGLAGTAGKAGAASASQTPGAGEASAEYRQPGAGAPGAFRSAQTEAHAAAEESAFSEFLDHRADPLVPAEPIEAGTTWQLPGPEGIAGSGSRPGAAAALSGLSHFDRQQMWDGQGVVDLLSGDEAVFFGFDENVTLPEADIPVLRDTLFSRDDSDPRTAASWDNALNFVPDFVRLPDGRAAGMATGVADPAQATRLWLEHWHRVLASYADDVWGDLNGLVREAREELRQLEDAQPGGPPLPQPLPPPPPGTPPPSEPGALLRLRQVLAHLRR